MFKFAHPTYLLLILPVILLAALYFYSAAKRRKNIKLWGEPKLLGNLMPNVSFNRPLVKFIFQIVSLLLLVIVLARPQFGVKQDNVTKKGIEVMVALDVSNSMLAEDIQPNRLEKAKQILSKLVDKMTDDKVGMVVFAGDAYIQLPITSDYVSAKMFLSSINTGMVPRQGTAIGSAIDLCIKSFGQKTPASKAIILITDGENHEDDAIAAAKLAAENKIKIYVIGMGKEEGAPIPVAQGYMSFKKDRDGNVVVSKLNEQLCMGIAQASGGVYVRSDNSDVALKTVSRELDRLAKTEMETKVYSQYDEQFQSFAFIALFILVLEGFIFGRKNKKLKQINIFDKK